MATEASQGFDWDRAMNLPPRCGFPRLIPLLPRLGIYVVVDRCDRDIHHAGRHHKRWSTADA